MKTRSSLLAALAVSFCVLAGGAPPALAHGNTTPLHGGVLALSGDTSFELVVKGDDIEIYVVADHEEFFSEGLTGKLTVTTQGVTTSAALEPAGDNRFVARNIKVASGASVAVSLTLEDGVTRIGTRIAIP